MAEPKEGDEKVGCAGAAQLSPEELQRRKLQRELQAYARKLKAQGQEYKPQKHKRKVAREQGMMSGQPNPKKQRAEKKGKKKSRHDTPSWRPVEGRVQVVVLPIFWNMRRAEKDAVLKAATQVEQLLQEAGLSTHMDTANQYTPGQKMKYWETVGVRVRVELGPKDAESGTAVIALAGTPGTVAKKKTVNATVQLVKEVKAALARAEADDDGAGGEEDGAQEQEEEGADGTGGEDWQGGVEAGAEEEDEEGEEEDEQEGQEDQDDAEDEEEEDHEQEGGGRWDTGQPSHDDVAEPVAQRQRGTKLTHQQRKELKRQKLQEIAVAGGGGGGKQAGKPVQNMKSTGQAGSKEQGHKKQRLSQAQAPSQLQPSGSKTAQKDQHKPKAQLTVSKVQCSAVATAAAGGEEQQGQEDQGVAGGGRHVQRQQQAPVAVGPTGDDLGDDFEIDPEFLPQPEEEVLIHSKKERLKAAKKNTKEKKRKGRYGEGVQAWDADLEPQPASKPAAAPVQGKGKGSAKKKAKVVVF